MNGLTNEWLAMLDPEREVDHLILEDEGAKELLGRTIQIWEFFENISPIWSCGSLSRPQLQVGEIFNAVGPCCETILQWSWQLNQF